MDSTGCFLAAMITGMIVPKMAIVIAPAIIIPTLIKPKLNKATLMKPDMNTKLSR